MKREPKWHLLSLVRKHNTVCGLEPLWYQSVTNSLQPRIAMYIENATCERCLKFHASNAAKGVVSWEQLKPVPA